MGTTSGTTPVHYVLAVSDPPHDPIYLESGGERPWGGQFFGGGPIGPPKFGGFDDF